MTYKFISWKHFGKALLKRLLYFVFLGTPVFGMAQGASIKVDLNQAGRREKETNELGYSPWIIRPGGADSASFDGIRISLSAVGTGTSPLSTDWYKAGIENPYYARLVSDGVSVTNKQGSAAIEMRITGLTPGPHTLLTYHNEVQSPEAYTFSPLDIYVNGKRVVKDLTPSVRALTKPDAAISYLHLNVTKGEDVVILFKTDPARRGSFNNVIINGFEVNTPDPREQASLPGPSNGDGHVEASHGIVHLHWQAGAAARTHDLYIGTDSLTVARADHASPLFKGNLRDTAYTTDSLYSMPTYYWRVDEVSGNTVTPGDVWQFTPAHLAFPGAQGYGRYARGGRGGKVVVVTNLNDSGPGSLRAAVSGATGPRTVVFDVGGLITLNSRLNVTDPFVTIAGQTAPGKGICIRKATFGITGNDVVVRFVRVRLGHHNVSYGGMGLTGCDYSIVDHCSISWTMDEAFSSRGARHITLQRTLISEALNVAGHHNYPPGKAHGFAASIGGDIGSFHHNLLADCYGRNWSLAGGVNGNGKYSGRLDIRDNVVYNWGTRATDGGAREVNFVNNYYKPGPGTTFFYAFNAQHEGYGSDMQRCYFAGNLMPGHFNLSNESDGREISGHVPYATYVNAPFFPSHVTTQTAEDAYKNVLSDVGCNEPRLDDHDTRIIHETLTGTYSVVGGVSGKKGFPDDEKDAGGYENYPEVHRAPGWDTDHDGLPDWWEKLHGLNPNSAQGDFSDANGDLDGDGYTRLDNYLAWMARPHFSTSADGSVSVDLGGLARGYTSRPVFSVTGAVGGDVSVHGSQADFHATRPGLCSFEFQVKDSSGDTMTRKINVLYDPGVELH